MLRRLKSELFASEVEKTIIKSKVDNSHDLIHPKSLEKIVAFTFELKSKNELLNLIYKYVHSTHKTLMIKALIVLHSCLRKTFDPEVIELIMNIEVEEEIEEKTNVSKNAKENFNEFIDEKVIKFYCIYLKKMCVHKETYLFIKENLAVSDNKKESSQDEKMMEVVSHGFKILNLTRFTLTSQEMFNKMGRYHSNQQEIISMFIEILEDLSLFNNYLKVSVKLILAKNKEFCQQPYNGNPKTELLTETSIQVIQPKVNRLSKQKELQSFENCSLSELVIEETKHEFLFINEFQKLSDRLYEFYYNRYYYKNLSNLIIFPTFMTIENKDYRSIIKKTQSIDKNLVDLVRMSKYEGGKKKRAYRIETEPSLECSMHDIKLNVTLMNECAGYQSLQNINFFEED